MALSNAERQARHRERLKQKLAAVAPVVDEPLRNDEDARAEGIQWLEDELKAAYYGTAVTFLEYTGEGSASIDRAREAAVARFESEEIFYSDLVKMVEECAYGRLVDFFGYPGTSEPMSWRRHAEELKKKRVT